MAMPAGPTAHFIVIQTDGTLRLFKALFDGPPAPSHLHHSGQRRGVWRKHDVRRQLRRLTQTSAYQEPAAPVGLPRGSQGEPPPVIPARTFGAVASAQPGPALRPQRCQNAFDLVLPTRPPDILFPRDRHNIGMILLFQPHSQLPIIAIDAIAGHPRGGHTRLEGALEHLTRQLRFGGKKLLGWYPSVLATCTVICPGFRQIEGAIKQRVAVHTRVGQKHADLAILHSAGGAAILPCDPNRLLAFFEKSGFIEDQHRAWLPQVLDQIGAQIIADGFRIPACPPQQMLETVGGRVTVDFCQLPAVFALHGAEQAPDIGPGVVTGFAPRKVWQEPAFHFSQPEAPFPHCLEPQATWGWALFLPRLHSSMPPQGVWNYDNIRSTTVVLERVQPVTDAVRRHPYALLCASRTRIDRDRC